MQSNPHFDQKMGRLGRVSLPTVSTRVVRLTAVVSRGEGDEEEDLQAHLDRHLRSETVPQSDARARSLASSLRPVLASKFLETSDVA